MIEYVFPYMIASLVTVAALVISISVLVNTRRRALELDELEQRMPDAIRLQTLETLVKEAQDEWDSMKEELYEARSLLRQKEDFERRIAECKEELLTLDADRDMHKRLLAELEEVQRRHSDQLEKNTNLEKELVTISHRVENLRQELEVLEPKVMQFREEEKKLRDRVSALSGEKEKLEQLLGSWRQQAADAKQEAERVKKDREDLRAEVNSLTKERNLLDSRKAGLEQLINRLGEEAGQSGDRLADLWQPVLKKSHFDGGHMPPDESKCLEKTRQYMFDLGLRFPDRVLKAFHTSLKVARISPLTVLAGISGTGKSLLPRRYAEGMGMHFLNIAVQPRWDSPQDMFGFFNYMEGRYRATELARALVQMDPYYAKSDRGWGDSEKRKENNLSKQMLVVLLDEMNLARVEYYFSEFLSRLEIRREIDPDDDKKRRDAEIPLEVGGIGGSDSILRLFAGTNVVFVGTMNEDETTQTLSDKVVDR